MKKLNTLIQKMNQHEYLFIEGIACMTLMLVFGIAEYTVMAVISAVLGMLLYLKAVKKQDDYNTLNEK